MADISSAASTQMVKIPVVMTDKTSATLQRIRGNMGKVEAQSNKTTASMQRGWTRVNGSYLKAAAALAGILILIRRTWQAADAAAIFAEQEAAVRAMASAYDESAEQILEGTTKAARGLISMADAAASRTLGCVVSPR